MTERQEHFELVHKCIVCSTKINYPCNECEVVQAETCNNCIDNCPTIGFPIPFSDLGFDEKKESDRWWTVV